MPTLDPFAVLPTELALHLLAHNFSTDHDLVHLWTTLRNVSRAWRALTDAYIRVKHLPTTCITYTLRALPLLADPRPSGIARPRPRTRDNHAVGPLGRDPRLVATFTFDALCTDDPTQARFSDKGADRALRGVVIAKALRSLRAADGLPEWRYPLHVAHVRHFANDTPLPGLRVDWVTLELRCDWRAVYTHLLYEEKLRLGLTKKWIFGIGAGWRARSGLARPLPAQPVREETLPYRRCGAWHDNSSREARKRRLMRSTASSGQGSWIAGPRDLAKFQELKEARVALDRIVFADEDAGEGADGVGGTEGAGD